MSTTTRVTADQLLRMPDDGYRYELVAGALRKMVPAGWKHGAIAGKLHTRLGQHIDQHELGTIFGAETGFLIARDPDTVRAPVIAFVHKDRLPATKPEEAYWPGAPDLAVEVVSPGDRLGEVDDKVAMWLDAGAGMVWIVNPKWRNVTVYRSATDIKTLTENDELDGQDVVPGFRCLVADIFLDP
jgi:Uma2 family endonuclease